VVEGGGREERPSRTGSRSKSERIKIKMTRSGSVGLRNTKRDLGGLWVGETGVYWRKAQSILLLFARARGLLRYLFFFNINRVRG
jgi:hypothetical protein